MKPTHHTTRSAADALATAIRTFAGVRFETPLPAPFCALRVRALEWDRVVVYTDDDRAIATILPAAKKWSGGWYAPSATSTLWEGERFFDSDAEALETVVELLGRAARKAA